MNILVTGCGGDIGQSIGKILNDLDFVDDLYGCDVNVNTAAKFIFKNFFKSLPCSDSGYIASLEDFVRRLNIDLVIPVSEPELRFFSNNKIKGLQGCKLLIPDFKSMEVGFDKYRTIEFLKENQLPYPITFLLEEYKTNLDKIKFPSILKARKGSGSKSVFIVNDSEELPYYFNNFKDFIIQEKITGDGYDEYTCGLFRTKSGEVRSIIINRTLISGFTGFGIVENNSILEDFLKIIAERLNLIGAINVQLKLVNQTPYVFEINPRFSSTVRFRDLVGFQDLKWAIQDAMDLVIDEKVDIIYGTKFYKGYSEYIEKV